MLRSLIVIIFVVVFLILSIPVWGVLFIIGLFNKKLKDKIGYNIVAWAFHVVWWLSGTKPIIRGLENIPKDQPVLYIGNHASFFDVILGYSICPAVTGFMSKKEFEKIPLLSVWMKMNYCLFLTRTDPREDLKLILKAIDFVKEGISIFIFPEGTRSKDGTMAPFHEGSFKIATKTDCPIIPVAFTNTRACFEQQLPRIKKQTVVITFGKPIIPSQLEGENKKRIGSYVQGIIQDTLVENEQILKEQAK